jgi:hypothetical protein
MSRIRNFAALTALAALALPGFALAAPSPVNGGSTQITLSPATSQALSTHHVTVTPLPPATAIGSTLTFPIAHGQLNKANLRGVIFNRGGFAISNGTRTIRMRRLTIVSKQHHVWIWALIRMRVRLKCIHPKGHPHRRCGRALRFTRQRIGYVTDVTRMGNSATGTLRLTKVSARAINTLAGRVIAKRGSAIGKVTVTPTFG